jgi:hypothetical protein
MKLLTLPNLKLEGRLMSTVHDCLFNMSEVLPSGCNLRMCHVMMEIDLFNMDHFIL